VHTTVMTEVAAFAPAFHVTVAVPLSGSSIAAGASPVRAASGTPTSHVDPYAARISRLTAPPRFTAGSAATESTIGALVSAVGEARVGDALGVDSAVGSADWRQLPLLGEH
jgi:hypothetical protein